jgi:hypothetical protein
MAAREYKAAMLLRFRVRVPPSKAWKACLPWMMTATPSGRRSLIVVTAFRPDFVLRSALTRRSATEAR